MFGTRAAVAEQVHERQDVAAAVGHQPHLNLAPGGGEIGFRPAHHPRAKTHRAEQHRPQQQRHEPEGEPAADAHEQLLADADVDDPVRVPLARSPATVPS